MDYDHLDYQTIKKLKDKVSQFYVPLGVGSRLARWGVEAEKIKEFDWWNEFKLDGQIPLNG
ncbi:MAG: MBL fold metallo-hydrolase [Desulfosporosinus sp.]|nr:MBL fold metallo-hydrolase [Desulfosporosinus sp.]